MPSNINALLRKVAGTMAEWPVVGRFVRISAAIFRLPELKAACLSLNHRQDIFETEQVTALQQTISVLSHQLQDLQQTMLSLNHRQDIFETEQVPALHNLLISVPVVLRKITRDLIDIRCQLESATTRMTSESVGREVTQRE